MHVGWCMQNKKLNGFQLKKTPRIWKKKMYRLRHRIISGAIIKTFSFHNGTEEVYSFIPTAVSLFLLRFFYSLSFVLLIVTLQSEVTWRLSSSPPPKLRFVACIINFEKYSSHVVARRLSSHPEAPIINSYAIKCHQQSISFLWVHYSGNKMAHHAVRMIYDMKQKENESFLQVSGIHMHTRYFMKTSSTSAHESMSCYYVFFVLSIVLYFEAVSLTCIHPWNIYIYMM